MSPQTIITPVPVTRTVTTWVWRDASADDLAPGTTPVRESYRPGTF